jgi:hypothetical protein
VTRVQLRLLNFAFLCLLAQERSSTGRYRLTLWDPAAVTMGGRPTLHMDGGISKDPPGSFSCPGVAALPERTLGGVRVWCWPRVPTKAIGGTVGTRGTHYLDREQCPDAAWQAQDRFLPKR